MIELRRIDHICLQVADVAEAAPRWAIQFGLTIREQTAERALLACSYEPYSLELVRGERLGHDHTGWELRRGCTLDDARGHLRGLGAEFEERDGAILLRDPEGIGHQLMPYREPASEEARRPDIARSTTTIGGFHPRKLGHMNCLCADIEGSTRFYTDVLGMRVSDYLGDGGIWFHINADHHVMALVNKGYSHFHHLAWEWVDWGELRTVFDHLAQHGRWLGWGPVRHGLARNLCGYARITEEPLFVENYCDMEQLEPDHQPRSWPDDRFSSNTWGPLPPRSYFRFDPVAVDYERQSLEMLGEKLPAAEVHS